MKAISIGFNYYEYPEGIASLEEFVQFLKDNYYSFIKLKQWQTDKCCYPYFIESEYEWVYLNVAQLREVSETREDDRAAHGGVCGASEKSCSRKVCPLRELL